MAGRGLIYVCYYARVSIRLVTLNKLIDIPESGYEQHVFPSHAFSLPAVSNKTWRL
jgi:hypothetical protein